MKKILVLLVVFVIENDVVFGNSSQEVSLEPPTKKRHIQKTLTDFGFHPINPFPVVAHLGNIGASPDVKKSIPSDDSSEEKLSTEGRTESAIQPLETPFDESKATPAFEGLEDVSIAKEDAELTGLEKIKYMNSFSQLAWEMEMTPDTPERTALKSFAKELKKLYEDSIAPKRKAVVDFVKKESYLRFCCSLLIYYLGKYADFEPTANWIKEIFPEVTDMSKNSILLLLKDAPGQGAYYFRQSIENCDDVEGL